MPVSNLLSDIIANMKKTDVSNLFNDIVANLKKGLPSNRQALVDGSYTVKVDGAECRVDLYNDVLKTVINNLEKVS